MATIEERCCTTPDGARFTVRAAVPEDAPAVIDLLREVDPSGATSVAEMDERDLDPERKARGLRERRENPGDLVLVAEAGARVVAHLECASKPLRRLRHVASFHMGVHPAWRRRGVGRALLGALVAWARSHSTIEKLVLGVLSTNAPAIALYAGLGFRAEGRLVREVRLGPGRYVDDVQMALFVK